MYIFKYTATNNTWGNAVKAGETFTVEQSTTEPCEDSLVLHLMELGREFSRSAYVGSGGMNVGETKTFNEWIIERVK